MVRIDILSATPELLESPFSTSILRRAIEKNIVEVHFHNLRDYGVDKHQKIDDYQFGGGSGMVLMIEPIDNCIKELKKSNQYDEIILMTPDAKLLNQKISNRLSTLKNIIIICGHYKGVDQRVRDNLITMELSIGDYVLSGGELPAAVLCDSIIRLIPGVLNNETSALSDSFQDNLLGPPVYTRPSNYNNLKVPDILLSGDKGRIEDWREKKSIEKTKTIRPELLK